MDRPGGMDSMKWNFPKPTEKSRPAKSEMGKVAKAAGGPVDMGQRSRGVKMPPIRGKGERGE